MSPEPDAEEVPPMRRRGTSGDSMPPSKALLVSIGRASEKDLRGDMRGDGPPGGP